MKCYACGKLVRLKILFHVKPAVLTKCRGISRAIVPLPTEVRSILLARSVTNAAKRAISLAIVPLLRQTVKLVLTAASSTLPALLRLNLQPRRGP